MGEPPILPEHLLMIVEETIRSMPSWNDMSGGGAASQAWSGKAVAVIEAWDFTKAVSFRGSIDLLFSNYSASRGREPYKEVLTTLHQAANNLRMRVSGPLAIAVPSGKPQVFFDEIRHCVESAKVDIFFIDPYLNAEVVSRYLPFVTKGVFVRLLGSKYGAQLVSAATVCSLQEGLSIEVRTDSSFHDRFVLVDHREGYFSGASFKDGGFTKPAQIVQITDGFEPMQATYESLWSSALKL